MPPVRYESLTVVPRKHDDDHEDGAPPSIPILPSHSSATDYDGWFDEDSSSSPSNREDDESEDEKDDLMEKDESEHDDAVTGILGFSRYHDKYEAAVAIQPRNDGTPPIFQERKGMTVAEDLRFCQLNNLKPLCQSHNHRVLGSKVASPRTPPKREDLTNLVRCFNPFGGSPNGEDSGSLPNGENLKDGSSTKDNPGCLRSGLVSVLTGEKVESTNEDSIPVLLEVKSTGEKAKSTNEDSGSVSLGKKLAGPIQLVRFVGRKILLSFETMRRILNFKESIMNYGVFVPRNDGEADASPEHLRWESGRMLEWMRLQKQGTFGRNWDWDRIQKSFPNYKKGDVGHVFFVYDYKHSGEHRVRLVFDGSRQNPETYTDTYAPTARGESVRLFHIYSVEE
jgi:hypothetical protein